MPMRFIFRASMSSSFCSIRTRGSRSSSARPGRGRRIDGMDSRSGGSKMSGPLAGFRVIEFAGIGPGPFCAMMLADHGAEVIRIDRAGSDAAAPDPADVMLRSRRSIALDLNDDRGRSEAHTPELPTLMR